MAGRRRRGPPGARRGLGALRLPSHTLDDTRLLAPIGRGPGGWADETYQKLALHALVEVAHHGGEMGLLRDLYLREGFRPPLLP
ncbi:hypothetical protein ACW23B_26400 [Streptomyces albidoflavus]